MTMDPPPIEANPALLENAAGNGELLGLLSEEPVVKNSNSQRGIQNLQITFSSLTIIKFSDTVYVHISGVS